jgi:hypothetical protein
MICNPRQQSEVSALGEQLAAQIAEVYGNAAPVSNFSLQELAQAIEFYVGNDIGSPCIDSLRVTMLASQALSSMGEDETARRLLVFGSGLIRPSEWAVVRGKDMWVLDLKQMMVREDAWLEMVFFESLSVILESMADVWDRSAGRGVLGLRHVCAVAADILGHCGKKKAAGLAGEIMGSCTEHLTRIGAARGWKEIPDLLNLDLK